MKGHRGTQKSESWEFSLNLLCKFTALIKEYTNKRHNLIRRKPILLCHVSGTTTKSLLSCAGCRICRCLEYWSRRGSDRSRRQGWKWTACRYSSTVLPCTYSATKNTFPKNLDDIHCRFRSAGDTEFVLPFQAFGIGFWKRNISKGQVRKNINWIQKTVTSTLSQEQKGAWDGPGNHFVLGSEAGILLSDTLVHKHVGFLSDLVLLQKRVLPLKEQKVY